MKKFTAVIICTLMALALGGCTLAQTILISKGTAGGFAQIFSGNASYCKLTTSKDVPLSQQAQDAFITYCAAGE